MHACLLLQDLTCRRGSTSSLAAQPALSTKLGAVLFPSTQSESIESGFSPAAGGTAGGPASCSCCTEHAQFCSGIGPRTAGRRLQQGQLLHWSQYSTLRKVFAYVSPNIDHAYERVFFPVFL